MNRAERVKKRLTEIDYYTKKAWWGKDETILTSDDVEKEPLIVRKAMATAHVLRNMPVEIKSDELIVGIAVMASVGFGMFFPKYTLESEDAAAEEFGLDVKCTWGHPLDYPTLINKGVDAIKGEIYAKIAEEAECDDAKQEKIDFYRAMLIALDGLIDLADRYADLAMKTAGEEKDITRKKELIQIAQICSKVPRKPAETLQEALQSLWFLFIANHSTLELVPVGRSDQYLYPFYKHDIETNLLTKEEADELICTWMAKFSERIQMNKDDWEYHNNDEPETEDADKAEETPADCEADPGDETICCQGGFDLELEEDYNYGTGANYWMINMMLGGVTPEGKDGTNELTYSLLHAWAFLDGIEPVISVRFHKDSPRELYDECMKILRQGSGGVPIMYNDEMIVQPLTEAGIRLEDARDYCNDGCWEVLIPGKSDLEYQHLEMLQVLEYVLQHGRSIVRNRIEAPDCCKDLSELKTYEDFYACYMGLAEKILRGYVKGELEAYRNRVKIAPAPLVSAFMADCIECGRDKTDDGCRYFLYQVMVTGIANFSDAMYAIKHLVYDEGKFTLDEIAEMCRTNFEGQEAVRQRIINKMPKVGNDIDDVDEIMVRVLADVTKIIDDVKASIDDPSFILSSGIATFEHGLHFGRNVGATPDGRLFRAPISSNFSPSLGLDLTGPTAAMKSMTKPDLHKYMTGSPLDLQFNINEVQGDEGISRMSGMAKAYFDLGGNILTLTGTSRELLVAAQEEPDKYPTLRVRLGGYSAYFTQLSKETQDAMIMRSKHSI